MLGLNHKGQIQIRGEVQFHNLDAHKTAMETEQKNNKEKTIKSHNKTEWDQMVNTWCLWLIDITSDRDISSICFVQRVILVFNQPILHF